MGKNRPTRTARLSNAGPAPSQYDIQCLLDLLNSGKLADTESRARQLIRESPGAPILYNLLSAALAGQGKFDKVVATQRRVLKIMPDYAEAYYNLGVAFQALGKFADAAGSFRRAVKLKPDLAEAHNNLAHALKQLGKPDAAIESWRRAVEAKPDFADAHYNLGVALKAMGRAAEAVAAYGKAAALRPAFAEAHNGLGVALTEIGEYERAAASCRRSVEARPDFAEAHHNLGIALQALGRFADAAASFERAVGIDPELAGAHYRLGVLLERMNDLERAREHTRNALRLLPDHPAVNLAWAVLLRREGRVREAIEILEPFTSRDLADADLAPIHAELGKLYDREPGADTDKAFAHFTANNALAARMAQAGPYRKEIFLGAVELADWTLTPEWLKSWTPIPDSPRDNSPAFLVGFPRSGTTLLDQVLDSHPAIQVMEEKEALRDVIRTMNGSGAGYPFTLAELTAADLEALRGAYFDSVRGYLERRPGTLLVDKMPLNICNIPLILRLFPNARIVLAMRHPLDVVLSNFMQFYKATDAMVNFFTLEDAAHCYAKVMGLWLKSRELLCPALHTVRYESLVADFPGEVRELLGFLGLEWDPAVLDYDRHARSRGLISTPSYQSVTGPVSQAAKYRWKRYEARLRPVLGALRPFIEAFGYGDNELPAVP